MGDNLHERVERALSVLHRVGVDRACRAAGVPAAVRGDAVDRDTSGAAAG